MEDGGGVRVCVFVFDTPLDVVAQREGGLERLH